MGAQCARGAMGAQPTGFAVRPRDGSDQLQQAVDAYSARKDVRAALRRSQLVGLHRARHVLVGGGGGRRCRCRYCSGLHRAPCGRRWRRARASFIRRSRWHTTRSMLNARTSVGVGICCVGACSARATHHTCHTMSMSMFIFIYEAMCRWACRGIASMDFREVSRLARYSASMISMHTSGAHTTPHM